MENGLTDPSPGRKPSDSAKSTHKCALALTDLDGEFNPYAPPKAPITPCDELAGPIGEGTWRDDKTLVMTRNAVLPDVCVKCGEPADGYRLKRRLRWHPQAYILIIIINIIIYAIVALIVSKRATIYVGLCGRHRSRRHWAIAIGWLSIPLGFVLMIVGAATEGGDWISIVGVVALIGGVIYGIFASRIVTPTRIDKSFIRLRGVHPSILAPLPDWPGRN